MRAFVGMSLPDDVRASLGTLQRTLEVSAADVKWVEPANLHVTIKFLDEITEEQRQAIEGLLARVAEHERPFPLGLEGIGAFPSLTSPRVVWVGLTTGKEHVARIAQAVEAGTAAMSLRREERPFSPHLTLGRVRSSRHQQRLVQQLRELAWAPPAPWQVQTLTLYQSVLSASGPRYTVLTELLLGGPSAIV